MVQAINLAGPSVGKATDQAISLSVQHFGTLSTGFSREESLKPA